MRHNLEIGIKMPQRDVIVGYHKVTVREKLFRFLLGEKRKLMIIVPGDSVKSLSIFEEKETEDGKQHKERSATKRAKKREQSEKAKEQEIRADKCERSEKARERSATKRAEKCKQSEKAREQEIRAKKCKQSENTG